jgi:predicted lipoprotein with Yx(FWY)xxD motif
VTLRSRPLRLFLLVAPLALLAAACGDDDDDTSTATTAAGGAETTTTTTTASSETTTTTAASGGGVAVEVADSGLGSILVSEGRTLYLFMPDNGGPSTCVDACADTWPALVTEGPPEAGDGVDAALATAPRDDGTEQVTAEGWPLYFFSGDAAAGDVNGQGIGGVWYVVAPDGTAIDAD